MNALMTFILLFNLFKLGDQILDVNGTSFLNIPHSAAVMELKSSSQLTITLRSKKVNMHFILICKFVLFSYLHILESHSFTKYYFLMTIKTHATTWQNCQ